MDGYAATDNAGEAKALSTSPMQLDMQAACASAECNHVANGTSKFCSVACLEQAKSQGWQKDVEKAKLNVRSELTLDEWHKYGFGTRRAAEFEALVARGDVPQGAIPRIKRSEVSREEFWEKYESKGIPCVISGIPEVEGWTAHHKWTYDNMKQEYAGARFKVGKDDDGNAVRLRVDHFMQYNEEQQDDSPVYLFDNQFGGQRSRSELMQEYRVPSFFPDDYMEFSGEEERPPYRWFSIGPRRSGTVMHQDPLVTSAWNTCFCGRKRWVILRPEVLRSVAKAKKVMEKDDDDEAVNMFIDLLPRLREQDQSLETFEFVQYPGDTVFLPGNWWHCVVNIDDTIAVTQNYCGRHNFTNVWRSARQERPCWSHLWLKEMDSKMPSLADEARRLNAQDKFDMNRLLVKNRERRVKRRKRREQRDLRVAQQKACTNFDEVAWRQKRKADMSSDSNSDSTVSTSSAAGSTSSSDDSSSIDDKK